MRILESLRQLPNSQYFQVCSVASGALVGYSVSESWKGSIIGALAAIRLQDIQSHSQSSLRKLCASTIPLSIGIATAYTIANRKWIICALAIAYFYPAFRQSPITTTSSAVFSAIYYLMGNTEKQALINMVDLVLPNPIFSKNTGMMVFRLVSAISSLVFGSYIYSLVKSENLQEVVKNFKRLGLSGGVSLISGVISFHLSEEENFFDDTSGIPMVIFGGILFSLNMEAQRVIQRLVLARENTWEIVRSQMRISQLNAFFRGLRIRTYNAILDLERGGHSSMSTHEDQPLIPEDLSEDPILQRYICPISKEPIRYPVLDPTNGISIYERSAIMNALLERWSSPVTRKSLTPTELIPLFALNAFIESRINDHSAIIEELEAAAAAELERHKRAIQKYSCPLSKLPIQHPVLDSTDGLTIYEKSAIKEALTKNHNTSPVTGKSLLPTDLIRLPALKRFIQNRRENAGAINETLESEAKAELKRHKPKK